MKVFCWCSKLCFWWEPAPDARGEGFKAAHAGADPHITECCFWVFGNQLHVSHCAFNAPTQP